MGNPTLGGSRGTRDLLADTAYETDVHCLRDSGDFLALLVRYAHVSIPFVNAHVFETMLIGYLVLLIGNLFRGL